MYPIDSRQPPPMPRSPKSADWTGPPHALTDSIRSTCISISQSLILRSHGKEFLRDLVAREGSGFSTTAMHTVPFGNLEEKSRISKKSHRGSQEGSSMLLLRLERNAVLRAAPARAPGNPFVYAAQIQKHAEAVREKRLRRPVQLLHDNGRPT